MAILKNLKEFWANITVEPVLLLFALCQGLYMIVAQSLYVSKVCNVNLNFTREVCDNIYSHKEEQIAVQEYVSTLQAYSGILQALPAVVYALFAGPWSDTHGRRMLIIMSCFGYVFNNGTFIVNTVWFYELRAEYLLFECLQDCTGGYVCFFLGCYSYISDISTEKQRTRRLAFLDGIFPVGFFFGMSMSGVIKQKLGYSATFGLGLTFALLAMFYAIFFLKDSRQMRPREVLEAMEAKEAYNNNNEEKSSKNACCQMFDVANVQRAFKTTFKQRPHGLHLIVVLLSFIFVMEIFVMNGSHSTMFLYMRKELQWDEIEFGKYMAFSGFLGLFTQYVAVPFLNENMAVHDSTIGILGALSMTFSSVMMAFFKVDWVIYLLGCISFLAAALTTVSRSLVTKCVGPFEVGAVFSIMGSFQAMVPLGAAPLYGFTYRATLRTFPGAFLAMNGIIYFLLAALLLSVNIGLRHVEKKKHLENQENIRLAQKQALLS